MSLYEAPKDGKVASESISILVTAQGNSSTETQVMAKREKNLRRTENNLHDYWRQSSRGLKDASSFSYDGEAAQLTKQNEILI